MWAADILRQFDIAHAAGPDELENVWHAPYNKLLYTLFPTGTAFTVIPHFQEIGSTKSIDFIVTFEVYLENRPVFVVELKRKKDLPLTYKRVEADIQLRGRLDNLIGNALLLLKVLVSPIYLL